MGSISPLVSVVDHQSWHDLYRAALFETDQASISTRIDQAEMAIVSRVRELFAVSADVEQERRSLETALEALRALQGCMNWRGMKAIATA